MNLPLPFIRVSGDYGSMGIAYGSQAAPLIARNVENYMQRFRDMGLSETKIMSLGQQYCRAAQGYSPDIVDMLTGVAEGASVPIEEIFALNARTEILGGRDTAECTSIAVLPRVTEDSHVLIGQNWDWHPEQAEVAVLLESIDSEGFRVLTFTEAGMLAKAGFNSSGIGLCANLLSSDRDTCGEGIPYHILLRGVLQSRSMADAIRATVDNTRVSSGNFLIADRAGEAVDIEAVPGDFGYLLPTDDILVHSNHFLSYVPVFDREKARAALTILRPSRARHLLHDAAVQKRVTMNNLITIFRDHYSFPNGICRHVDDRDPVSDRYLTVYSVVMDLTTLDYWIAAGPPCESVYVHVDAPVPTMSEKGVWH
ncbi:C45 family autoproteolytic acyltransferase/hydolase [Sulfobacillus harzensis]|uniref:Peptidase C45 hydrolase domain-containing protein n=1 Tax=Sulfobacillus harzensis TaxID=2729629 RepID=A0A7Y0L7Z5_9FIRM|nr:C45 family peptidase [Sulfobacillus harzensis]NMP23589.1 hypothetical protein [Sulfobacillus harzensis]